MVVDDRAALAPEVGRTAGGDPVRALEAVLAVPGGLVRAAVERLVRDAPIGFAVMDADLRYVLVNEYLEQFSGRPAAEVVGRTLHEIVPSVADAAAPAFRAVLETGEPVRDLALTGDVPGDPGVVRHWRESVFRVEVLSADGVPERGLAVLVWEVTDQVEAQRQMLAAQARLALLARTSDVLSRSLDEGAVLDGLVDVLVPHLADAVAVLLPDGAGRLLPSRRTPEADAAEGDLTRDVRIGDGSPAATAFAGRHDVTTDPVAAGGRRTVWAPMVVRGRSIGVVAATLPPGTADDVALVTTIVRRAAVALGNARLYGQQTRIAERLQASLLPSALPAIPGAGLAVHYATADEAVEVGGDFYDVFPAGRDRYVLVIGDVAGRGVDAAGMTGLARHTIRALAHHLDPAEVLTRLNEALLAQQHHERFLTAVCAVLDLDPEGHGGPEGTRALLTYANAGHCRPALACADGDVVLLDATGPLLGVVDDPRIEQVAVPLLAGDTVVLCTDGITEARRGRDLFGETGLEAALRAGAEPGDSARGADVVVAGIVGAVRAFQVAPSADDIALLVVTLGQDAA